MGSSAFSSDNRSGLVFRVTLAEGSQEVELSLS